MTRPDSRCCVVCRIVVVLRQKIYVYNFKDLKIVHQIETIDNPKGTQLPVYDC